MPPPPHSYSTAIDDDECALNNGGCQHKCINTDGSYYCSCDTGYDLQQDEFSCKGKSISCMCRNLKIYEIKKSQRAVLTVLITILQNCYQLNHRHHLESLWVFLW